MSKIFISMLPNKVTRTFFNAFGSIKFKIFIVSIGKGCKDNFRIFGYPINSQFLYKLSNVSTKLDGKHFGIKYRTKFSKFFFHL